MGRPPQGEVINDDILLENVEPVPLTSRGSMGLSKKDMKTVLSIMVSGLLSSVYKFMIKLLVLFMVF